ncbi:MAG TPA: hypothetical protein DCS04_03120 [Ruminococcaceae bacterium]|nr:hypothetical protein [Oscillospiraceae bacterium]
MKPYKIIFLLLIIIFLTACVGQKQLSVDEFLIKYNDLSSTELKSTDFTVTSNNTYYTYSAVSDGVFIAFYTKSDGVVEQCTVTSKSGSNHFDAACLNIIKVFTDFPDDKSRKFLKDVGDSDGFHLVINDYGIGKTMILNRAGNELNTNELPTLKREVREEDIARPTLSDVTDSTNAIRQ